jgi:hypothetical protein
MTRDLDTFPSYRTRLEFPAAALSRRLEFETPEALRFGAISSRRQRGVVTRSGCADPGRRGVFKKLTSSVLAGLRDEDVGVRCPAADSRLRNLEPFVSG